MDEMSDAIIGGGMYGKIAATVLIAGILAKCDGGPSYYELFRLRAQKDALVTRLENVKESDIPDVNKDIEQFETNLNRCLKNQLWYNGAFQLQCVIEKLIFPRKNLVPDERVTLPRIPPEPQKN